MAHTEIQSLINGFIEPLRKEQCYTNEKTLAHELFELEKALTKSVAKGSLLHKATENSLFKCVVNTAKLKLSLRASLNEVKIVGINDRITNSVEAKLMVSATGMARALNRSNAGFTIEALKIVFSDEEVSWNGCTEESILAERYTLPTSQLKGSVMGSVAVIASENTKMVITVTAEEILELARLNGMTRNQINTEFFLVHTLKRVLKNLVTNNESVQLLAEIAGELDEFLFQNKNSSKYSSKYFKTESIDQSRQHIIDNQ
ncbi:hypothetical protein GLP31_11515 [Photobacterium carnosum]|uniref:recombinase RecT n=1 Tax=Photobacterium carnosum TaxID=2023717 RepID=UPI001E5E13A8|nr:recombinase RecT [Photobacterium carnosum]MCD9553105.1 hypothetical protein [Photobacterium carnosum]